MMSNAEYVKKLVADFPPATAEQISRIRAIIQNAKRQAEREQEKRPAKPCASRQEKEPPL